MSKINKIYFFLATILIAFNAKLVYAQETICDNKEFIGFVNKIYGYVKIVIPILILVLGTMDFVKALTGQKDDDLKKAQATFFKRLIIGVVIFFIPIIIGVFLSLFNGGKWGTCGIG